MADFYGDISAVGNEYQAYADTPASWAVPQDGNGKAGPGHSAACPVVELTIAAVPTSGAISIYGATVTLTGVLSAGSTAACATALASSINATTTAVSTSYCKLGLGLKYFVYARVKPGGGANDSIVQVMCRIAGSDLNGAYVTNTFNNSALTSPASFASGADGPFAYLLNAATVFGKADGQSTNAAPGYGLFFAASPGPSEPGSSDVVHVRTKRSSTNLSVEYTFTGASGSPISWQARQYLFDDGTKWSGDNGKLTLTVKKNVNNGQNIDWRIPGSATLQLVSRSKWNFELAGGALQGSGAYLLFFRNVSASSNVSFIRCRFVETSDHNAGCAVIYFCDTPFASAVFALDLSESLFQFRGSLTNRYVYYFNNGSNHQASLKMVGTEVEIVAATGAIGAPIVFVTQGGPYYIEWIGGAVRDTNGVYSCVNPITIDLSALRGQVVIDSVDGVTDPSNAPTVSYTGDSSFRWNSPEGLGGGAVRGFRYQTARFAVDWKGSGFPYTTAADLRGTNWSHRVSWFNLGNAHDVNVLRLSYFYRSSDAAKTIKASLYIPDATTVYQDEIAIMVIYVDSSNVRRVERSGDPRVLQFSGSRNALASDSASWTANGVASYSAKKVELTTAYSIQQNTEVVAYLMLLKSRSPSLTFYASPELVLS